MRRGHQLARMAATTLFAGCLSAHAQDNLEDLERRLDAARKAEAARQAEAQRKAEAERAAGPRLRVRVSLDPLLSARLDPDATLFVFARAASGSPMPLAVHRTSARELPVTVTLDDSMSMLPSMTLSMFPQVIVGARLSSSGNAMAQSGDLQGSSASIDPMRRELLELVVDGVVP